MIKYFEELGNQIQKRWDIANRDEYILGEIAQELVTSKPIHEHVSLEDVVEYTLFDKLEHQQFKDFGQPPVSVYSGENFHIDVLFWLEATTAIHQHGFSGLFCVMDGSSVHSEYTFQEEQCVNQRLRFGKISLQKAEELQKGDSHIIKPAEGLIHGLFHLDHPSISVVIRTNTDVSFNPQYSYYYPHIAYDPFYYSDSLNRRGRMLNAMQAISHNQFRHWLEKSIEKADLHSAFMMLHDLLLGGRIDESFLSEIIGTCKTHDSAHLKKIESCLVSIIKSRTIINVRDRITNKDHRYLLALLLNVPDKDTILKMVEARYKEIDAVKRIHQWIEEINRIEGMDLNYTELQLDMIKMMLRNKGFDEIMTALELDSISGDKSKAKSKATEAYEEIKKKPLFEKLLMI